MFLFTLVLALIVTREHYICFIGILSKACDTWEIWRLVENLMGSVKTAHPQLPYESMIYRGLFKMEVCKHVNDIFFFF
ncbi:hypothetical protein N665_0127s0009 [Sinapis alba]|nr:hypothetical protein N665_0127s0009 [Sinapis alba]